METQKIIKLLNFCRSLKILLINFKTHLELNWIEDCILLNAVYSAKFKIMDAIFHAAIVTLYRTM